ncbi:MAG: efflux RND transporter permease subunit, partial [Burkholderiales bacterium]|nr:efflux RND transporter permease subunit [Burkholderiales bacterium]
SIIALSALGQTINIMTLGGLALAVGILVDDATVTIENINWHLEQGKHIQKSILEGAQQIVTPAFVSLLCICIVFVPMFFLQGVSKYLFVPLAEAVIFSMIASFILSRTLVPTMANYLLKSQEHGQGQGHGHGHGNAAPSSNIFVRFQRGFERGFETIRENYRVLLLIALSHKKKFIGTFVMFTFSSFFLIPWLGTNFFPTVDAGQIKLHIRAKTGTRLEETARICDQIERKIRGLIPQEEVKSVVDNIGLPVSGINLSYSNSSPIGPADADILITLNEGHKPTDSYIAMLRDTLKDDFPSVSFAFLPADIISQILNFGLPAPIDVQIVGFNRDDNKVYAAKILKKLKHIPGLTDIRIQQAFDQPELRVNVDRSLAQEMGFTPRDIASSLLVTLSGSFQTAPNFWVNPKNHVSYPLVVQVPQYRSESQNDLQNILVSSSTGKHQILGGFANISRGKGDAVISHYDVQPAIDIFGSVQSRDLGSVAGDIEKILKETESELPKGSTIKLRGQA